MTRAELERARLDVLDEASRLRAAQRVLVQTGELGAPEPSKIRKAERLENLAAFLNDIGLGNVVVQRAGRSD